MYTKILVPVDGGEQSDCAVEEAASLQAASGANILLLHVIDPLWFSHGMERHHVFVNDVLPAMRRHGYHILDDAHKHLAWKGVPSEYLLEECGDRSIGDVIIERAKVWGADLIVMGSQGRRGLARMFMGSVAESVVRMSPVPVMLARQPALRGGNVAAGMDVSAA